jgi:hypothetical protein
MTVEQKVTRKLRAILSADVKGYSLLMTNDEAFTIKTLKKCRIVMSAILFLVIFATYIIGDLVSIQFSYIFKKGD